MVCKERFLGSYHMSSIGKVKKPATSSTVKTGCVRKKLLAALLITLGINLHNTQFFYVFLTLNGFDPAHRQGDGPPVFLDLAGEQIRSLTIDHVAEAVVGLGEKSGFNDSGFIFEG
jgi:hypothetical protein